MSAAEAEFSLVGRRIEELLAEHDPATTETSAFRPGRCDLRMACVHFPQGFGGLSVPHSNDRAIDAMLPARRAVPRGMLQLFGLALVGPTMMANGSDELRHRLLCPARTGEDTWRQLFSQPGVASHLASLITWAIQDGNRWVVIGLKVCVSIRHVAARRPGALLSSSRRAEAAGPRQPRAVGRPAPCVGRLAGYGRRRVCVLAGRRFAGVDTVRPPHASKHEPKLPRAAGGGESARPARLRGNDRNLSPLDGGEPNIRARHGLRIGGRALPDPQDVYTLCSFFGDLRIIEDTGVWAVAMTMPLSTFRS